MKNATDSSDGDAGTGSPRALRQAGSNARRSITKPELAACGACLVLLIALLVFDVSGRVGFLLAVGMLWALEYGQRFAAWAARERNEEEATWKLDS